MKADARRYCWLKKVACMEIVKIAHHFPLAQDYLCPDNCIDTAMGLK